MRLHVLIPDTKRGITVRGSLYSMVGCTHGS
jgi:hypothetical protein